MALQILNVLTKKKEPFKSIHEGEVRLYLCGVTVYGRCHVGHLRCNLSFDAICRYFKHSGYALRYVRNLTDIDDKIIMRAREITEGPEGSWKAGEAYASYNDCQWTERLEEDARIQKRGKDDDRHLAEVVADHFIDVFRNEDFGPFDLLEPDSEPRVSEHIPHVISLIEKIIEKGFAYHVDGDVYFNVPAYHNATGAYGKLSGRDYTQLMDGARVAPTDKKKSAPDFALWKSAGEGEPAWDSPWGKGRPGWHIECSAMSVDKLGQPFDIHGGGKDLIFPHHENEIAQSEAAAGVTLCNTWMHNGFVTVGGVKMSKSLGNFLSIKDALQIAPPEVWRFLMLSTHYAKPIDLSISERKDNCDVVRGTVNIAFERLTYFYESINRARALLEDSVENADEKAAQDLLKTDPMGEFHEAMNDDFNTAKALASLGEAVRHVNELCDLKAKRVKKLSGGKDTWRLAIKLLLGDILTALNVLGLCAQEPSLTLTGLRDFAAKCHGIEIAKIDEKLKKREEARAAKDWAASDVIRDELLAMGVEIKDTPTGTTWKVVL